MNYAYQVPRRVTVSGATRPTVPPQELPTGDLLREVRVTERQRVINEALDALGQIRTREPKSSRSWDQKDRDPSDVLREAKAAIKALGADRG